MTVTKKINCAVTIITTTSCIHCSTLAVASLLLQTFAKPLFPVSTNTHYCTIPHAHKSYRTLKMWWVATLRNLIASEPHTKLNKENMEISFSFCCSTCQQAGNNTKHKCVWLVKMWPSKTQTVLHDEVRPTSPRLSSERKQIWSHLVHQIPPAVCSKTAHNC